MNKHGFTLIELLAVIIMLSIILIITLPIVSGIIYNARLNSYVANEKMMIWTTKHYLGTNEKYAPINIGDTVEIKLSLLQSQGLISNIQNPWNESDTCGGYILVTKIGANTYDYNPYLKCQNNYKADSYIADKLTAYWRLDGNAYDYTPNKNQGTIYNSTATTNQYGIPNKAQNFNGPSNFIDTNYDYSLNYNEGATFSLWVKFATINTDGKIKNIFGKNSKEYILSQIDNKIWFTGWDSKGLYAVQLTSNISLQIDRWYNIVLTYDNVEKKVNLYVDGVLDTFGSVLSSSFEDTNGSLKIGRGYPDIGAASSTFFLGTIDNFCIYDRTWSPYEVKLNYDINDLIKK
jgi:prepilin-type N-terminal cleavage/methylation domain-containing protein